MQSLAPGDRSIKEYLVKIYGHIQLQYILLLKSHWAEIFLHSTSLDAYKDCTPCCIAYSIDLASLQVAPSGIASVKIIISKCSNGLIPFSLSLSLNTKY